jgi:hypothetical protein
MSLDELKSKLDEFIRRYSIVQFEAEDVVELVAEGESIEWIVNQLKGDKEIDIEAITLLLREIRSLVMPEEGPEIKEAPAEPVVESEELDPSQLDLSQIGQMLPEGVELPPDLDAAGIKALVESPQGKIMLDFLEFCREKGVDLSGGNLNDPRIERLQKEWQSTPRDAFSGKTSAEMLSLAQGKVETFRREDPRVGRNDPCPCGSGKKFKKCCGRK